MEDSNFRTFVFAVFCVGVALVAAGVAQFWGWSASAIVVGAAMMLTAWFEDDPLEAEAKKARLQREIEGDAT